MCSNKKQLLIIVLLCAKELIPVCTCFENTKPPPKPTTTQKPPKQNPPKQGDAVATEQKQTVSVTPDPAPTETISSLTALISTASVEFETNYIPISNAFIWPPPSQWENPVLNQSLTDEEEFIATTTRAHLRAHPQANKRQTIIDGTKWALCSVAVLFVGTLIYKIFTFPDRMLEEWRNELRAHRDTDKK